MGYVAAARDGRGLKTDLPTLKGVHLGDNLALEALLELCEDHGDEIGTRLDRPKSNYERFRLLEPIESVAAVDCRLLE